MDFETTGDALNGKGEQTAILLTAKLSAAPDLYLVERAQLEKILGEQELSLSGTISPDTAARVGNLIGAKILVTGRVFQSDDNYFAVAKVIGTETSRVYGASATFTEPGDLDAVASDLAEQIATVVADHGDTLVAHVEDPTAQIARLTKSFSESSLPSVSVEVSEEHLPRPVIDPAVQTELQHALKEIGFEVIDPTTSSKTPDIRITGEAFSELGGRQGNLVSCRARVELTATASDDGELILADRETDSGVDLSEAIAGKNALQNAARALLDRLVPALANR